MKKSAAIKLVIATPILMLLAHYLAVFAQEYAHSITAWLLGYKKDPLEIYYGGNSWINILLLFYVDERVDYNLIIAAGHMKDMALIALAGPIITNGGLYLLTLPLLGLKSVKRWALLFYFLFWFNFMNLANIYAYIPIRVFSFQGDMAHIMQGFHLSPWSIYFVGSYFIAMMIWYFFTNTMINAFQTLQLESTRSRAFLMIFCVLPLFGYFGLAGFVDNGKLSNFLSCTSFLLIPGALVACWPTRDWVRRNG